MSTSSFVAKDANGNPQYFGTAIGAGTSGSPYQPQSCPGDGTNQFLSGAAANLSAATAINAQICTLPGDKTATSSPAVNTAASATVAAGSTGVRHVCTGLSFTLAQDSTGGTPYLGTVNLRDGATGAGTVLMTWQIGVLTTANSSSSFALSNLNVVGSAATAMTLEYSAAGGAHTQMTCNFTYHDCV